MNKFMFGLYGEISVLQRIVLGKHQKCFPFFFKMKAKSEFKIPLALKKGYTSNRQNLN